MTEEAGSHAHLCPNNGNRPPWSWNAAKNTRCPERASPQSWATCGRLAYHEHQEARWGQAGMRVEFPSLGAEG